MDYFISSNSPNRFDEGKDENVRSAKKPLRYVLSFCLGIILLVKLMKRYQRVQARTWQTLYEKISRVHSNRQKKSGVIFRKDLKGFMIYIKFYSNHTNSIETQKQ